MATHKSSTVRRMRREYRRASQTKTWTAFAIVVLVLAAVGTGVLVVMAFQKI